MFLRRAIAAAAIALSAVSSGSDLLTSPAYMGVPGNVWNTMLICDGERDDGEAHDAPEPESRELSDHELWGIVVFASVGAAIAAGWFVMMARAGH